MVRSGRTGAGHQSVRTGEANGVRVERRGTTEVIGRLSRLRFDYVITDATGERRASEVHELGLFTIPEMLQAFSLAGLAAERLEGSFTDRGLYLSRIAA